VWASRPGSVTRFGSSLVSAYWNGAATYYRGLLCDLAVRGYDITFYEPDAYERQQHRDMEPPRWARSVVYPATRDGLAMVLCEAAQADVVIKASGVGVFDNEHFPPRLIGRIRRLVLEGADLIDPDRTPLRATLGPSRGNDPEIRMRAALDLVAGAAPAAPVVRGGGAEQRLRECARRRHAADPGRADEEVGVGDVAAAKGAL